MSIPRAILLVSTLLIVSTASPSRAAVCPSGGGAIAAFPGDQDQIGVATLAVGGGVPFTDATILLLAWRDARNQLITGTDIRFAEYPDCIPDDPAGGADVCSAALDQELPRLAATGHGGYFYLWANASVIVAFQDHRNGTDFDIYGRRMFVSGGPAAWDTTAAPICTAAGDQTEAVVVGGQSDGGAIIAWVDRRSGNADIYAQRVDSAGVAQWTAGGVPICSALGDQTDLHAASDGAGGVFLCWFDRRGADAIYAARVTSSGALAPGWAADGNAVTAAPAVPGAFRIAADHIDGLFVGWTDTRDDPGGDVYAQRMDLNGSASWGASGTAIASGSAAQVLQDLVGDCYVVWTEEPSAALESAASMDLRAQRIDSNGAPVSGWPAGGFLISGVASVKEHARAAGTYQGLIVAWSDQRNGAGNADIFAFRVLATGEGDTHWTPGGTLVCGEPDDQVAPEVVYNYDGGAKVVWMDYRDRAGNGADVYGANLTPSGQVDAPEAAPPARLLLGPARPNPARGAVAFRLELPVATPVSARIVDVSGRAVRTLADGSFAAGAHELAWDGADGAGRQVRDGVYFVVVRAGAEVTRRVVMLR